MRSMDTSLLILTTSLLCTFSGSVFGFIVHSQKPQIPKRNYRIQSSSINDERSTFSLRSTKVRDTETTTGEVESFQEQDKSERRVALLVFPAQFCVPADYDELWDALPDTITIDDNDYDDDNDNATTTIVVDKSLSRVVPLSRRDWAKVAKQLPTRNFVTAQLRVHETLDWYFDAVEDGLSQILGEGGTDDLEIAIVGHSIGGWVARAYLGGLSKSSTAISQLVRDKITRLVTLGTPHVSPDTALVDQTRGLLREIAETPSCSSTSLMEDRGIDVTCVCSSSLKGKFLTTNVEEFVAASSYLPLLGTTGETTTGDGIVPLDLAFMEEPARKVVLDGCQLSGKPIRHSHVLPTPYELLDGSTPSIRLSDDDAVSYVSPGVVSEWAKFL